MPDTRRNPSTDLRAKLMQIDAENAALLERWLQRSKLADTLWASHFEALAAERAARAAGTDTPCLHRPCLCGETGCPICQPETGEPVKEDATVCTPIPADALLPVPCAECHRDTGQVTTLAAVVEALAWDDLAKAKRAAGVTVYCDSCARAVADDELECLCRGDHCGCGGCSPGSYAKILERLTTTGVATPRNTRTR